MLERKIAIIILLASTAIGSVFASSKRPAALPPVTFPMPPASQAANQEMIPTPFIEVPTTFPTEITVQSTAVSSDVQSNAASIMIVVNTPAASTTGSIPEIVQNEPSECRVTDHPGSDILARRYTVSETEIVDWLCQGFTIGDVSYAYILGTSAGVPARDIFALRTSGMGWGEIKQHYGLASQNKRAANGNKEKNNNKESGGKSNGEENKPGKKP